MNTLKPLSSKHIWISFFYYSNSHFDHQIKIGCNDAPKLNYKDTPILNRAVAILQLLLMFCPSLWMTYQLPTLSLFSSIFICIPLICYYLEETENVFVKLSLQSQPSKNNIQFPVGGKITWSHAILEFPNGQAARISTDKWDITMLIGNSSLLFMENEWAPLLQTCSTLWPCGLKPARLLSAWNSPGKNTRVGCHALLLGIFLTQGLNPGLLNYRQILYCWATGEVHFLWNY